MIHDLLLDDIYYILDYFGQVSVYVLHQTEYISHVDRNLREMFTFELNNNNNNNNNYYYYYYYYALDKVAVFLQFYLIFI